MVVELKGMLGSRCSNSPLVMSVLLVVRVNDCVTSAFRLSVRRETTVHSAGTSPVWRSELRRERQSGVRVQRESSQTTKRDTYSSRNFLLTCTDDVSERRAHAPATEKRENIVLLDIRVLIRVRMFIQSGTSFVMLTLAAAPRMGPYLAM